MKSIFLLLYEETYMKNMFIRFLALLVCAGLLFGAGRLLDLEQQRTGQLDRNIQTHLGQLDAALRQAQTPGDGSQALPGQTGQAQGAPAAEQPLEESSEQISETFLSEQEETLYDDGLIEELTESLSEGSESVFETETETEAQTEPLPPIPANHHIIFVGDSRTVGMGRAEAHQNDGCTYIGESGEGYEWLLEPGIELMDEAIRKWPDSPVVLNFGVNDCSRINAYIEVYHELERGYPDTKFYYMSVNPVTKESKNVPLSDVLAFNRKLKAEFPDQYIDTCSWMIRKGFEDVDGVHYSWKQYCAIHDFAARAIMDLEEEMQTE